MEQAQDQAELFDVVDPEGRPVGQRKPRGLVHRDGDWHRSVHIWVWSIVAGEPHILLQRRSAAKDTHPRRLDVAVTGHVRAGESIAATLREAEEEIGLRLEPGDVVRLGLRRRRDTSKPGIVDNEVQEILAAVAPVETTALRPSEAELEAIVGVPLAAAERVIGRGEEAMGVRLAGKALVEERIRGAEMVPAPDGYYARAFASVAVLIGGGRPEEWVLG